MVLFNFVLFVTYSNKVAELEESDTVSVRGNLPHEYYIMGLDAIIGSFNGLFIFVFILIYDFLSKKVVKWENH